MIYRSNLIAPDLQPHFKHVISRPMPHSFGHDVLSDWADKADDDPVFGLYKKCGFWTHDEAAILYNIAAMVGGFWLDIGSHTGWTSAHIGATGANVCAVDNMYPVEAFLERFLENMSGFISISYHAVTSSEFFCVMNGTVKFDGIVIDGDHDDPVPTEDAKGALAHLKDLGVILLHDAIGEPVQKAVRWLISQGLKHKIYYTPHVVACCWNGDFTPPEHIPDPRVERGVHRYILGL